MGNGLGLRGLNIGFCCLFVGVIIDGGDFLVGFGYLEDLVISSLFFDVLFWGLKIVFWFWFWLVFKVLVFMVFF